MIDLTFTTLDLLTVVTLAILTFTTLVSKLMTIQNLNENLLQGNIDDINMFPHIAQLKQSPYVFESEFGLADLPEEPGILLIRGARQYGKSTWLEQQIIDTIQSYGAGSAFYLNGDYIADARTLAEELESLAVSFASGAKVRRIFIDEITNIDNWEIILKRLVDNGTLKNVLVVTTGSKATDLRRGSERLPGRKGKLAQTNYLFTPISYKSFHHACYEQLKEKTLPAYLISGGSPIACSELATRGYIPEYVIQLVRDWVEGEITKSGRYRTSLINVLNVIFRFGGTPVGQAKLAREADLSNNTVAQGYVEILNDLGCIIPAYPMNFDKDSLVLRKPCKYHYMNLLVALAYHPAQPRRPEDLLAFSSQEQGIWYEWCVAQELQRRLAIHGGRPLEPMAFWQNKSHEIDFITTEKELIEVKLGQCQALEFAWFAKQFKQQELTIINKNNFKTDHLSGVTLEEFLLKDCGHK